MQPNYKRIIIQEKKKKQFENFLKIKLAEIFISNKLNLFILEVK